MAEEKEIEIFNSCNSEFKFFEESEDTIKNVPDEREYSPLPSEIEEENSNPWETDDSPGTREQVEKEIHLPFIDEGDRDLNLQPEKETEILLNEMGEQLSDRPVYAEEQWNKPNDIPDPEEVAKSDYKISRIPGRNKIHGNQKIAGKPSRIKITICAALIGMITVGFADYFHNNWTGSARVEKKETPVQGGVIRSATPAPQPVTTPAQPSKRDRCREKLADAVQLRNELLEKRDEIYELTLHYHNRIAELVNEIHQEIEKKDISSYKEAINNTPINLKLRTIQRRMVYIKELKKPADWLESGSEELYFLVRRAEVDLQMTEIAGGIDLNKHISHIGAAIDKYHPSPDKLAVDPFKAKPKPLERIWQQVSTDMEKKARLLLNPKDEIIIEQICGGNISRIAELTSISPRAAQCLSHFKGLDLFLNGLKTLSPDIAKQLSQWQGNWICLNGINRMSAPAARHLFNWQGNWISLNSLDEFPPELAKYLLKWEGRQLELMGLKFNNGEADKKTLKYLTLWETTGGKVYVSDRIRRAMANLM